MEKFFSAAFKSIGSIFAPGMFSVFFISVLITLLALVLFIAGVASITVGLASTLSDPQAAHALPWVGGVGATMFAYFLFPGIMPVIVNFFDSKIARLIEAKDYPNIHPIDPPFWPEFWHDFRFSLTAIGLNILVFPLYFIPLLGQLMFYALNGYLLGKEFFIMAARRHMKLENAIAMRRQNGRIVFAGGVALAILATIPLVNLLAPFWGIALMIHLFHGINNKAVEVLPPLSN